jgi:hypothetical protein
MRLTILGLWIAANGSACSCAGYPSVGEAWGNAAAIVIGEVTGTDPVESTFVAQTARVRVVESFKGPARGEEMVFRQPGQGCSPRFKKGTRALLYAYRAGEAWQVYGCGRGSDYEAEDLLFLRSLPRSAATTRLSGTIRLQDPVRPLTGVTVQIASATGTRSAVTNSDGVYEVYGLAAGQYTVTPKLPAGLKVRFPMILGKREPSSGVVAAVRLSERSTVSASFVVQEDNRISGRVLDPEGKALRNVCLDLETLDGQRHASAFTCTREDGGYTFDGMPSGQYRIVVNRGGKPTGAMPFRATYYPGVTDRAQATVVTVSPGVPRTGLNLRIAKVEKRAVFAGRVRFRDGVPIVGAVVELFRDGQRIERALSGPSGSFEIAALDGGKGELRASVLAGPETLKQCPHWQSYAYASAMNTQTLPIALETPQSGLYLTISVSSCPGHLPGR